MELLVNEEVRVRPVRARLDPKTLALGKRVEVRGAVDGRPMDWMKGTIVKIRAPLQFMVCWDETLSATKFNPTDEHREWRYTE